MRLVGRRHGALDGPECPGGLVISLSDAVLVQHLRGRSRSRPLPGHTPQSSGAPEAITAADVLLVHFHDGTWVGMRTCGRWGTRVSELPGSEAIGSNGWSGASVTRGSGLG